MEEISITYQSNQSTRNDIYNHLCAVDNFFSVPLSARLNIDDYADKLYNYADRLEVWNEKQMIGLVAYYHNKTNNTFHISNVSVEIEFQKKGIAHNLLSKLIEKARDLYVRKINLIANRTMFSFYFRLGFSLGKELSDDNHELEYYVDKKNILVSICCLTYNHEKYIRDCLDGFVNQKTNFNYEILIHDDASTDGTVDIIREYESKYPTIIKPIYQVENQYSKGKSISATYNWSRVAGKYIAQCEGDDYWTDQLKLQKQVDFLEANPEYDMVCARFNHLVHETGEIQQYDLYDSILQPQENGFEIKQEHFVSFAQPHPCTVMFRTGTLTDHPIIPKLKYRFDIPVYYCFLYLHRVWLMNEKMAVYRKHKGSLTVSGETENWSLAASHKELLSHFPNDPNLKQLVQQDYRKYIIKESNKKDYTIKQFILHLSEYIKHRPKLRNIISLVVKIIKIRIKLHKNHE